MNKAYMTALKVVALVLTFVLGMLSTLALIIGVGVVAAKDISLNKLEEMGIKIDTSELLDDDIERPVRDMPLLTLIEEINFLGSIPETVSFDYLSKYYGLILPPKGQSDFFDAMRVTPFSILFTQEGVDQMMEVLLLGDLIGYQRVDNPNYNPDDEESGEREKTWYDPVTGENVWIVESIICDYTLYQLVYEGIDVPTILDQVPIGEIFGYHPDVDGIWKDSSGEPVHGVMSVIADKTLNNLEGALDDEPMGHLLEYRFVEDSSHENGGYWINPNAEETEVAPFMQYVASKKFSELNGLYDEITIADIIPDDERTGYISLVDPETHLSEISGEVNRVFREASLTELVTVGAITFDTEEEKQKFLYYFGDKPGEPKITIDKFIDSVIDGMPNPDSITTN